MSPPSVRSGVAVRPSSSLRLQVVRAAADRSAPPRGGTRRRSRRRRRPGRGRSRSSCARRLDRREDVPPLVGTMAIDVELAEGRRPAAPAGRRRGSVEESPADAPRTAGAGRPSPARRRLKSSAATIVLPVPVAATTRFLMPVVALAFDGQLLEHLGLVRPGRDVEEHQRCSRRRVAAGPAQGAIEALAVARRVVVLVLRALPVAARTWRRTSRGCPARSPPTSRTFHSTPSISADFERFDEPM